MIFDIYDTLIITQVYRLNIQEKPLNIKLRGLCQNERNLEIIFIGISRIYI